MLLLPLLYQGAKAQTKTPSDILYENGTGYYHGIQKDYNPSKGKMLLEESAGMGNRMLR